MVNSAITARGLRKAYGDHTVLDGIDLTVAEGTIFSLLGPNGAGKTTTVQILTTLIAADGGDIAVGGHDVAHDREGVRELIGVTGQFAAVDELLTGRENLHMMGDLNHLPRRDTRSLATELLERFDLVEAADKPASTYSGGMTRRLDLAMTLVGNPRVIFLDEPTTGLDPRSRRAIWDIIRGLVDELGVTVFLTTQYLEEADQLADRIAVLDHGRIVAEGTAAELKRLIPGGHIRIDFADQAALAAAQYALGPSARVLDGGDGLTLAVPSDGGVRSLRAVLDLLDAENIEAGGISVHTPNLDDVFLTLTGRATIEQESLA
ncbi:ATP-binding cassette domain-containing protein [Nocardia rhizosphaerihabitans]|uniref:Daunorubicin resistance protein DrrA family ABC transporter ATP-binding protein n=1 Tax=Nocardia rhizosphaerihabitans TaxID=1691570 RepID=A0ABQ2L095_9NOCA|nr:ATP-binding cassette domain-containing protein [Nocardia rhizosphaerihabitans]GGN98412.1 daunorubicin resistance protein DrrA family ABC transporter ATP-binding protein [Nocardia rhizosphaerihabitans]